MVVARQQTLVQLTDELLALLDEKAAKEGTSRSELIRQAIERYLRDERKAEIDAAIVEAYTRMPQPDYDPWAEASAIASIKAEPW